VKRLESRARGLNFPWREPAWVLRAGMMTCALVAFALLTIARVSTPNPSSATTLIGRPAPPFTLPAAQDGMKLPTPTRFSGTSAHPTLLVFFNTLCVHCLGAITAARQAAATAPGGPLNVVFIDTPGENAQITGAYMARLQFDMPVLLDSGGVVAREYRATYWPTLALVDERGVIRGVWVGETTDATLSASIRHILSR
jgi:thiol-disulfide isomerase/thioredoxin